MIVIGIDPHMKTHTAVALYAATGRSIGEKTVACTDTGRDELLAWARRLDPARVFAIEESEAQLDDPHDRGDPGANAPACDRVHGQEALRRDEQP